MIKLSYLVAKNYHLSPNLSHNKIFWTFRGWSLEPKSRGKWPKILCFDKDFGKNPLRSMSYISCFPTFLETSKMHNTWQTRQVYNEPRVAKFIRNQKIIFSKKRLLKNMIKKPCKLCIIHI